MRRTVKVLQACATIIIVACLCLEACERNLVILEEAVAHI